MEQGTDKFLIKLSLVNRLVATQFPEWVHLPIRSVECGGWDNRTFHLGDYMTVRLPSAAEYANQVAIEHHWLPKLAPQLPLPIPIPLAMGKPGEGYPWPWSIYRWLDGKTASVDRIDDLSQFAKALGEFLVALQHCDAMGGPISGPHNFYRGGDLAQYDAETRQAIAILGDGDNVNTMTDLWNKALASIWQGASVWVHGDIAVGNLLVDKGRLCAVIDFGQLCIGDPACDLAIAWTLFKDQSREAFRKALALNSATWARARGWTLWKALCAPLPGANRHVIDEVLADHKHQG
ncbi:MAG: aminoglycoside phosphotransferase family protein [Gammaproteobacteria bacterium]|nr:aminoglycoside phosphotransferase family protein [Gammaproteobacteria bacterium]